MQICPISKKCYNLKMKNNLYFLVIFIFFPFQVALSQGVPIIAQYFETKDAEIQKGDIVSLKNNEIFRTNISYDENIIGVVGENPLLVFGKETTGSVAVISYGKTLVKVTNQNGEIKKGDFITSSQKPGVGQKATESGFVIGMALEDLKEKEGIIPVFVNIQYLNISTDKQTFGGIMKRILSSVSTPENVPDVLKYLFSISLISITFLFSFLLFVKTLKEGIVGISQNPLAKNGIQTIAVLNLIGIIILTLVGIGLSLFVILNIR